jgi:hypothetical protein
MITELVDLYEKGAITADHLAVECLHMVDPADPQVVLAAVPAKILQRILAFAATYQPDGTVTNFGPLPTEDQVIAAKDWIQRRFEIAAARE